KRMPPALFPSQINVGDIGAQEPAPGTPVVEGAEVRLTPAGKPVKVPDVRWTPANNIMQAAAEQRIKAAGLGPSVLFRKSKAALHAVVGGVAEQWPVGNDTVLQGSAVTLYVCRDKPVKNVKWTFDPKEISKFPVK